MDSPTSLIRPRAYSYVRMSTEIQLKGDSLRRQMELSRRYATEHGLELIEGADLHDIAVSAFKGANVKHGALGRFLAAIKDGRVPAGSYLLVESLDRLSRENVMTALGTFMEVINSGVSIVTLADGQVYKAGETEFHHLLQSIVVMSRAHEESKTKSHRISAAWKNKRDNAETKKLTARCPGWLQLSPDRRSFVVLDDRAAVVRRIFEESASGIGNYSIGRRLNGEGVEPFGRSRGWQTSSIAKILNNRAVLGEFQPHKFVGEERLPEGEPITDYFPAIIDEQLFFRAQGARHHRRAGGGGRRGEFISNLFSGLAQCAYCGGRMHYVNKGPGPKGGSYLLCDMARRGMGCERIAWRYDAFEASFLAFVEEIDLAPMMASEGERERLSALEHRIEGAEGRLAEAQRRRDRTYQLVDSDVAVDYLTAKLRDCSDEMERVELELVELRHARDQTRANEAQFYESRDQIKDLIANLGRRDNKEIYRIRAQIAAKLKGLVSVLLVAANNSIHNSPKLKIDVGAAEGRDLLTEDEALLRDELSTAASDQANFIVIFKDGGARQVWPDPADALRIVAQRRLDLANGLGSQDGKSLYMISTGEMPEIERLYIDQDEIQDIILDP